ncbi:MAG: AI-2E family transporter [Calditrichaeota bacterium]|nr:MAG: AI-2E family transporter [Calditrichota bacterium]
MSSSNITQESTSQDFTFSPWKNPANLKLLFPIGAGIISLFLLSLFSTLFFIALLALVLTSVLKPMVFHLEKEGINAFGALVMIYALFLLMLFALVIFLGPEIAAQLRAMAQLYNSLVQESGRQHIAEFITFFASKLDFLNSPVVQKQLVHQYFTVFIRFLRGGVQFTTSILYSIPNVLVLALAVFLLLKDGDRLQRHFISTVPNRFLEFTCFATEHIQHTLSAYLRRQFYIIFTTTVFYSLAFYWLGIPFSILVGFLAGFASVIPFFGLLIGAVPVALVGIYSFDNNSILFVLLGLFAAIHFVQTALFKQSSFRLPFKLHPLYTLVFLVAGYAIWGMWGVFFAVPLAVCFICIIKQIGWGMQNFHF